MIVSGAYATSKFSSPPEIMISIPSPEDRKKRQKINGSSQWLMLIYDDSIFNTHGNISAD